MAEVNMPKLSDTMEEGTVLEWKKQEGEEIKRGDVLAEVESDKASFELEAEADGKLQILVQAGTPTAVGAPIAQIGGEPVTKAPSPVREPVKSPPPSQPAAPPPPSSALGPTSEKENHTKSSPLARRLARERGLDLANIEGSGPGGRIVKKDVLFAGGPSGRTRAALPAESVGLNRMQMTIARRMVESKSTVPH
ncbi:MAG: biotin/lipoyl-containing protein, partial [Candidatus Dormibacteraceae bacterium]